MIETKALFWKYEIIVRSIFIKTLSSSCCRQIDPGRLLLGSLESLFTCFPKTPKLLLVFINLVKQSFFLEFKKKTFSCQIDHLLKHPSLLFLRKSHMQHQPNSAKDSIKNNCQVFTLPHCLCPTAFLKKKKKRQLNER